MTATVMHRVLDHHIADPPLPATPRVMVIAPGPLFSTYDVWESAASGLRACGVDVLPHDYHTDLQLLSTIEGSLPDDAAAAFGTLTLYASHRAVARALAFRPDLILAISGTVFPPMAAALLGLYTPTAVWLTESPYQSVQELVVQNHYRVAFTNERRMVEVIQERRYADGHAHPEMVAYLPHGYDPARHYPRDPEPQYACDVLFIGSPFPERQALLRGVNWTGIDFHAQAVFSDPGKSDVVVDAPEGNVPNAVAQRMYASAKININHHRTIRFYGRDETIQAHEAESLNPRVYELAAGRCFQICDDSRPELQELFGDSIPTYRAGDSADLERVIRHYLAHPAERERCAEEAYQRVQAHTVAARMERALSLALPQTGG